jgi:TatD-related deoxyribonuclease
MDAGGTYLIIVHKPYKRVPNLDISEYERAFRTTIEMKGLASDLGAKADCVVGPYPGDLPYQCEALGADRALELQLSAVGLAMDLLDSGEVLGIGEVGRVHFPVAPEMQNLCDRILLKAMEGASKRRAPVVLHTESLSSNENLMAHLGDLCDKAGLSRERAIKHYSDPKTVRSAFAVGLSASMLCRKDFLREMLIDGTYPLLETDYIDDPSRPDVVLPPDSVPKKVRWARETGLLDDDAQYELMVLAPRRIYGIDTIDRS